MMSKILLCLAFATVARANDWDLVEEDVYAEPRLLDGVFNNTSIDLNGILALVLIAILALITIGPNFLGGGNQYNRNGYQGYDYYDYYNENQFYKRSGFESGEFYRK